MEPIYCKKKFNTRSKKAFLLEYLNDYAPETYWVADDVLQCSKRRRRSIGDLNALLNGTFKTKTSFDKLVKILLDLVSTKNDGVSINCLYCDSVEKLVFYNKSMHPQNWTFKINNTKHSGYQTVTGEDGHSWRKIEEIYNKQL